jgi:hypothetical protein
MTNPNATCRRCGASCRQGSACLDVGAMFLGLSAVVCPACTTAEDAARGGQEARLLSEGMLIEHRDDPGWRGGRWYVVRGGMIYGVHSYRDGAIMEATTNADHATPWPDDL